MVLAWPLSRFVSYNFGMLFFDAPLEFAASISGFVIWLKDPNAPLNLTPHLGRHHYLTNYCPNL